MKDQKFQSRRKTGRPLSFDPEAALKPAMLLFWQHGFEATSLAELTQAMGITPPSVYAAYGDKKGLFRAAVHHYLSHSQSPFELIQQAPTAKSAACALIEGAAIAFTGEDTPAGCLLASSAIAVSSNSVDVRNELAAIRCDIELALSAKIQSDIANGAVPEGTDPATLAAFVSAVIQGLSTLARDGANRSKLLQVAQLSLAVWPSKTMRES
ncbi:MAG: TetR family transcriptional regulator [Methylobacterium sp.]|nr:MAG: TetR family transcriptional regulator [Methylobacterium sp.]